MSDLTAQVSETADGFQVLGVERINYDFIFLDNVFHPSNTRLSNCYKKWGRCLMVADANICDIYGKDIDAYFKAHGITLTTHRTKIGEKAKTMETMLDICTAMTDFGIIRKEPVLVIGGGLITDVAG